MGGLICCQFIWFKIEVNTSKPLAPGFYITHPSMDPHWIAFKFERLDDYCVSCGLIGHKKGSCSAPKILDPLEKYNIYLKPTSSSDPRMVAIVPSEDSNSGLSSAASVGNSQCSIKPFHALTSSSKNISQTVPHMHNKNTMLTSKEVFFSSFDYPTRGLISYGSRFS